MLCCVVLCFVAFWHLVLCCDALCCAVLLLHAVLSCILHSLRLCARLAVLARCVALRVRVLRALLLNARIRKYQKSLAIFGYESVTVLRQEF